MHPDNVTRYRLSPTSRVVSFAAVLAAITAALLYVDARYFVHVTVASYPWPLLLCTCVLAQVAEIHIEFRENAATSSLTGLSTVIGLVGFGVAPFMLAR